MFGFIHRLFITHKDEEGGTYGDPKNEIIYFKLCIPYDKTGVYKASKSYVIRAVTKANIYRALGELRRRENIIPDLSHPEPYSFGPGIQTALVRTHKEYYQIALIFYLRSINADLFDYDFITEVDQKIAYLECRLRRRKDYKSLISVEKLFDC